MQTKNNFIPGIGGKAFVDDPFLEVI